MSGVKFKFLKLFMN